MIPYIVAALSILLIRVFFPTYRSLTPPEKKKYIFWALLPAFILSAFRGNAVGPDTGTYIENYKILLADPEYFIEQTRMESGFVYFMYILSYFSAAPQWIFILSSLLLYFSIGHFVYKNATEPTFILFFFITLGLFQFTLSGIRQTIAISLSLFTYELIKDKRLLLFMIMIAISMQFHKSAIFFLPAYFVANRHINRYLLLIILLFFFFIFPIENILLSTASALEYDYGIEKTGNGYIFFIISILIVIAGYATEQRIKTNQFAICLDLNIIHALLWTLRLISRTAERVTFYYSPYAYLALSEWVVSIRNKEHKALIIAGIILLCLILYVKRLYSGVHIIPYSFCNLSDIF